MKALLPHLCAFVLLASASAAQAQQVRYFEQNGVTYRETREVVRRPVYETTWQDRTCVTYRPAEPATRRCYRTERVPVTEYRTVPRWVGLYNPFVQPYLVYEQVPVVRYEQRTVAVDVPVGGRMVPVTGTQKVPVVTQRMVEEEVLRRVAVTGSGRPATLAAQPSPATPSPTVASRASAPQSTDPFARPAPIVSTYAKPVPPPAVGGIGRLESDPPREGTGWRAVR